MIPLLHEHLDREHADETRTENPDEQNFQHDMTPIGRENEKAARRSCGLNEQEERSSQTDAVHRLLEGDAHRRRQGMGDPLAVGQIVHLVQVAFPFRFVATIATGQLCHDRTGITATDAFLTLPGALTRTGSERCRSTNRRMRLEVIQGLLRTAERNRQGVIRHGELDARSGKRVKKLTEGTTADATLSASDL